MAWVWSRNGGHKASERGLGGLVDMVISLHSAVVLLFKHLLPYYLE